LREEFPGVNATLNKFLFKIKDLPDVKELPEGLRWGEMREKDLPVVQARTSIPRATRTLMSLKSKGVFEEATDRAVAWTFLGLDGSLTTLHTEPEWRGKGIAKAVAARIIRECAPGLAVDDEGNAWSHADVYVGNVQSESVCRSLGGKATWKHYWVRIDLTKAGSLSKDTSQSIDDKP
jgi:GNAT superfamily N-acetyltransferase